MLVREIARRASMSDQDRDLDNVINELLFRLEDHKYRWELYGFGLADAAERVRVRTIVDLRQLAVHNGGPAVLDPLRQALFTAYPDGSTPAGLRPAARHSTNRGGPSPGSGPRLLGGVVAVKAGLWPTA